ncbi:MAG: hypothetical protein ACI9WU_005485 [Myxococcota bacterium]
MPGLTNGCNDLQPCTEDSCDPAGGCINEPIPTCSPLVAVYDGCFVPVAPGGQLVLDTVLEGGYGPTTFMFEAADGGVAPPGSSIIGGVLTVPNVGIFGTFGFTVIASDVTGSARIPIAVSMPTAPDEIFIIDGQQAEPGPIVIGPGGGFSSISGVGGGEWVCEGNLCSSCSHMAFEHMSWVSAEAVGTTSDCSNQCQSVEFCTGFGKTAACRPTTTDCGGCPGGHQCSFGTCHATSLELSKLVPTNPGVSFDFDTDMSGAIILHEGWAPPTDSPMVGLPHYWLSIRMAYTISSPYPCDPSDPDLVVVRSVLIDPTCQ